MSSSDTTVLQQFLSRFILQPPSEVIVGVPQQQAAVLVPIIAHPIPTLLLTRRAMTLRKHAGQVAFPGGIRDANDVSLVSTALREAEEEIALPPQQVQVIGVLPAVGSNTGFQVTPVVGIIPPGLHWHPNAGEVESVFEMPLEEALRLSRYQALDIQRAGHHHRIWLSWFDDYFIWGLTAGIIRRLGLQVEKTAHSR